MAPLRLCRIAAAGAAVCALALACAPTPPPVTTPRTPAPQEPYLLGPLDGYPLVVAPEVEAILRQAGDAVAQDSAWAEAKARELLAADPGLHPAEVILAQVDFLRREDRRVLAILDPIVAELPDYVAAQLLRGRAAERLGEVVLAYQAYRQIRDRNRLAARGVEELEARAVEIVANRLDEGLRQGRVESARYELERLREWLGEDDLTVLDGSRRIFEASGDRQGELEVVRRLAILEPDRELLLRLGELELEIGDVRAGLQRFEELAAEDPTDAVANAQLERAKFLWRMELMPPMVRQVARKGELDRADLATLLYWLVPQIRYAKLDNPPIASDILDHPRRDEILRVVNLDLMRVDETIHRFDPAKPATRAVTFAALLRLLEIQPREPACLDGARAEALRGSRSLVCEWAARCRLIPEPGDCLPGAPIAGGEALEALRQSLDLMGQG